MAWYIQKVLKGKNLQSTILYLARWSFRIEGEILKKVWVEQQLINSAMYYKINVTESFLNGKEVRIYMKEKVTIGKVNI